jgi:hypothetical protein
MNLVVESLRKMRNLGNYRVGYSLTLWELSNEVGTKPLFQLVLKNRGTNRYAPSLQIKSKENKFVLVTSTRTKKKGGERNSDEVEEVFL